MSASRFDRLDRADDFMFAVGRWVGARVAAVGIAAWNTSPEQEPARKRAAGLMNRAALHVGAEVRRLHEREGIGPRDSIARIHERNRARTERPRAGRNPRPAGRAAC